MKNAILLLRKSEEKALQSVFKRHLRQGKMLAVKAEKSSRDRTTGAGAECEHPSHGTSLVQKIGQKPPTPGKEMGPK